MNKSVKISLLLFLVSLLTTCYSPLTNLYAYTATEVVNCNNQLGSISPYIYGCNSAGIYNATPMTDQTTIDMVKDAGITMMKFPPGACCCGYDFKYQNYQGRYFAYWGANYANHDWFLVDSFEQELTFCHAVGAEFCVGLNTAFQGPNGTTPGYTGGISFGGDCAAYTGFTMPDTPAHRAAYAADEVTWVRHLCDIHPEWGNWPNGTKYPIYYQIGNEWEFDALKYSSYVACYPAFTTACKAVDPSIHLMLGRGGLYDAHLVPDIGNQIEIYNYYWYTDTNITDPDNYVYSPGKMDGAWASRFYGQNWEGDIRTLYAADWPTHPIVFASSEWADYWDDGGAIYKYDGAIYTAHSFYRFIKNRHILDATWETWYRPGNFDQTALLDNESGVNLQRPRYFTFKLFKQFGNTLVECYDPTEYTPGVTDYFLDYKDDHDSLLTMASKRADGNLAIMAINLSSMTSCSAQITVNGFNMSGNIDAYVQDSTNCVEGGPGPSTTTLTGQSSPISYTFKPFSVTCLVVKGQSFTDTTPPPAIAQVRDGTGADVSSANSTTALSANWDAVTDPESSISKYYYAIGTSAGATDVTGGWIDNGTNTSVTRTGTYTSGVTYYFTVKAVNGAGLSGTPANSNGQAAGTVTTVGLSAVFPNPYIQGGQGMSFNIGSSAGAEVKIYTLGGKLVKKLTVASNSSSITWDGKNEAGEKVDRGVYMYKITGADGTSKTGKFAVTK